MTRLIAVALGSNLGDRRAHLEFAEARLRQLLRSARFSSHYETDPVGYDTDRRGANDELRRGRPGASKTGHARGPDGPPRFLNAAAVGETDLAPHTLLGELLAIENERGRERPFPLAPRTLDLDLILYGDAVIDTPDLVVPHPRFRERAFVLEPLASIAPHLIDPVTQRSIADLERDLVRRADLHVRRST
jgi:2-amino-4-hydroxy-6-hydroxymethyldihydropteridine diphosphokinase